MNATALYLPLALIGIIAITLHVLPRLARSEIYFAVTVPAAFREAPAAGRILRRYRLQVWLHSLVAAALVFGAWTYAQPPLAAFGMVWQLVGFVAAFLLARHVVMPHAAAQDSRREAVVAPRSAGLPGGWLGQLAPFFLLALIGWLLYSNWGALPERWPVHFGIDGRPDRWVERTPVGVLGTLATAGAACAVTLVVALGIRYRSRQIAVTGSAAARERTFQRAVLWLLLAVELVVVVFTGAMPLWSLWLPAPIDGSRAWLSVVPLLVLVIVAVLVFIRIGQGGSRLSPSPLRARPVGDRTPDDCWKFGLFYVNPDDPAIFVEKRIGIGYTVNFGQLRVWIALAIIIGLPLLMAILRDHAG